MVMTVAFDAAGKPVDMHGVVRFALEPGHGDLYEWYPMSVWKCTSLAFISQINAKDIPKNARIVWDDEKGEHSEFIQSVTASVSPTFPEQAELLRKTMVDEGSKDHFRTQQDMPRKRQMLIDGIEAGIKDVEQLTEVDYIYHIWAHSPKRSFISKKLDDIYEQTLGGMRDAIGRICRNYSIGVS